MYQSALHDAARDGLRAVTAALNMTYTASVAAVDATTPAAISGFRLSVIGSSIGKFFARKLLTSVGRFGGFEACAGEREYALVTGLPCERQLARANFPSGSSTRESIGVVAEHVLQVVARVVGQIVPRLHVCDAQRVVAGDGDHVIRNHVLRSLEAAERAPRRFGPSVGADLARLAAED